MTILKICEWLEATSPAVFVRESLYGFQTLVAIHLLGLILSVGVLLWVDLRLLGVTMQRYRLSNVYRGFAPWFLSGFSVMLVSGAMLFASFATAAYGNLYFRIKAAALVLAGANALIFHLAARRSPARWDEAPRPPVSVRLAGITSLALWATVILCGRMMSYTMF
jgi:hypothetical protein